MRIRWTEPAARDLTQICDYIDERDGPGTARRVAFTIYEGISSLTQFPYRGRPGPKGINFSSIDTLTNSFYDTYRVFSCQECFHLT